MRDLLAIFRLAAFVCALTVPLFLEEASAAPAGDSDVERVVAMEWAQLETLLALGVVPIGAADATGYEEWVGEPPLPNGVTGIGSRREPNLEELARLDPGLILSHAHLAPLQERLEAIAPVAKVTFGGTGTDAYGQAVSATRQLAELIGREAKAQDLIAAADKTFQAEGHRLADAGLAGRKVYFVRIVGPTALRVHGRNSIAAAVLERLGLVNAWQGEVNEWGFATVEPDALAGDPDAAIIVAGPVTDAERDAVFGTPIGQALPAVRAGTLHTLPAVWTFGGVSSAARMAREITDALTGDDN